MVLGPFAETKGPRLQGRNPASNISFQGIWGNKKMSHHHRGDHDFLYFTMHTNILHGFFAPNCCLG
jgi:hypothetical protein